MKLWTCTLWMALATSAAWAHPDVDDAKAAFARGEFKLALLRLERADRSPDKTDQEVMDLLWYRGASLQRLGRPADAAKAFDALLQLRPLHEPDKYDVPPDLRAIFKERARLFREQQGVVLGTPSLKDGQLQVDIPRFPERVTAVAAFVRVQGDSSYTARELVLRDGHAEGALGTLEFWRGLPSGGVVEVALEARNARGTPLARAGDAVEPVKLAVDAAMAQDAVRRLTPAPVALPSPAPAPVAVETPASTEESGGSALATPLLAGAAVAGGVAALVLLAAALSAVAAAASWGIFGGTWYAASSVKGIQVSAQYGLITQLYQYSLWPAVAFSGVGALTLLLGAGSGTVAAVLFVLRRLNP